MTLEQLIDYLRGQPEFGKQITHWEEIPPQTARYANFPGAIDDRLRSALKHAASKNFIPTRRKLLPGSAGERTWF